ncbi:hypothetical protein AAG570_012239 [Ranatra chinensis]|uniref:Uncharacterized protein n=1 Tax=Ranatra chinensis TaxID=642074 RepID=A0ABD0YI87_9HEMI
MFQKNKTQETTENGIPRFVQYVLCLEGAGFNVRKLHVPFFVVSCVLFGASKMEDGVQAPKHVPKEQDAGDDEKRYGNLPPFCPQIVFLFASSRCLSVTVPITEDGAKATKKSGRKTTEN